MVRIARLVGLALFCILLAAVPVALVIFWPAIQSSVRPGRRPVLPQVARPPAAQTPAVPVVLPEPPPPRKGNKTWADVEAAFNEMQTHRDEHPEWVHDLAATYAMVASPAYTDSLDLQEHCVKLAEWREKIPSSPTGLVALARAQIEWAWEARGPWVASSVTEERWQKFHARIAEARPLLERAIELGPKDGEAYRLMILVAMAEKWPAERARATLDEGRRIDPTYYPLYVQFARYLLPRWHGKRGDIERFAAETAALLPGDDGLEACARIVKAIHHIDTERELVFFGSYDRALLVKASEVLRERAGGGREETEFAALCAWAAQDRQAGQHLHPLLGQRSEDDRVWPWAQQRGEFDYWCRRVDFEETDNARWFWGSLFDGDNLIFSADSRAVWCGEGYGPSAVNCLDIERGSIIRSLRGMGGGINCLAVDEAQGWVVAGITGNFFKGMMCWDLHDPDHPRWLESNEPFRAVAISPTEPWIARATIKAVQLLNIRTGERGPSFDAPQYLKHLRFSADGKSLIVSASHESVWDMATGELRFEMPHTGMRPIPDGVCKKILDIDAEGHIWALVEKTKPAPQQAGLVKYAPDGKGWEPVLSDLGYPLWTPDNAALSADRSFLAVNVIHQGKDVPHIEIEVWNVTTGKKVQHFAGHMGGFMAMCFSPDGKWLASMGFPSGLVKLWPIEGSSSP